MINKEGSMSNDAQHDAPLHGKKTEMSSGNFSQLDYATEENNKKHIGDYTVKTRNFKIADAIAEYLITTPKAKI
jgi:hypothetical protein